MSHYRAAAADLGKTRAQRLAGRVRGVILEVGRADAAIIFATDAQLVAAWTELHRCHAVPMTADEVAALGALDDFSRFEPVPLPWPGRQSGPESVNYSVGVANAGAQAPLVG